jgi:hypothetical protein
MCETHGENTKPSEYENKVVKGDVLISQPLKFSTKPRIARQSNATLLSFTNVAYLMAK